MRVSQFMTVDNSSNREGREREESQDSTISLARNA